MESYADLLGKDEWQFFRLEVINSRSWKCEHCKNKWLSKKKNYNFYSVQKWKNLKFDNNKSFCFLLQFSSGVVLFSSFFWTNNINFFIELNINKLSKVYIDSFKNDKGNIQHKVTAIKVKKNWVFISNMHVHHNYYQEGLKPWEYPEKSLSVLCWSCHQTLHENTYIPHLDKKGNEIGKFKTCWKCFGAGYLPEYNYNQGGICFGCNGTRYNVLV